MKISDLAVRQRTTVFVLAVILILAGIVCYFRLPREAAPEVIIPNIFVSTTYRGVSAEIIEKQITKKIEDKLRGLDGVKEITSTSSEGSSQINVEFIDGTDIDQAEIDVKDAVDRAKPELPDDLEDDPLVYDLNLSERPFYIVALKGDDRRILRTVAEDLEEDIEAVPGILEVDISGGLEREIHIEVDPLLMAMYGVDFSNIPSLVAGENSDFSGGSIRTSEAKLQVKISGEFENASEAAKIIVATRNDGSPVYLDDIAIIEDGSKDLDSDSSIDGKGSVNIYVKKRSGENIVALVEKVKEVIQKSSKSWPAGIEQVVAHNEGENVEDRVADLENNIITGLILVIIVVCFAMGVRNAILVSLSIPISFLCSFIILSIIDVTLNMVVLFGLTISLGMLVDNAIVIVENIYRFMQNGVNRMEAAKKATAEVAWAIIGSTLTTIGAFLPMIWWSGVMGQFMRYIPITVIVVLLSCLFVALVINPAMAAVFMKVKGKNIRSRDSAGKMKDSFFVRVYRRILRYCLGITNDSNKQRFIPRFGVLICAGLTLILSISFWMYRIGYSIPVEFFPSTDPQSVDISFIMPSGASLEYCNSIIEDAQKRVFVDDYKHTSYKDAAILKNQQDKFGKEYKSVSDIPNIEYSYTQSDSLGGDNKITIQFIDMQDRTVNSNDTIKEIEKRIEELAGADFSVDTKKMGPPQDPPVNFEIAGPDLDVLSYYAQEVKNILRAIPFVKNVQDDSGLSKPTLRVDIDRKRAALLGLSSNAIGQALATAINGMKIDDYRDDDDEYDIMLRLDDESRRLVDILSQLFLQSSTGRKIPLSTVTSVVYTNGIGSISRKNHSRLITVSADVDDSNTSGEVVRRQFLDKLSEVGFKLPAGYTYTMTGEKEDQQEASNFLLFAGGISIALIFFVLVAQFNSVAYPFIILTSVLLSLTGVFFGLAFFEMPFGIIMTGVGVISLAGVVVNNAIVLIDYILLLRENGHTLIEAIEEACVTRLRPVFLTTLTTVLGFMPMVTGLSWDFHFDSFGVQFASESTQMWQPMAVAMMFGLIFATILTLLVVPTLVSLIESIKIKIVNTFAFFQRHYTGVRRKYRRFALRRMR